MGTATFDLCHYAVSRGNGAATIPGELLTSGAHTTSTSASDLTDGAAGGGSAISAPRGAILYVVGDEDMRVAFGGDTATASAGHYVPADTGRYIEVPAAGAVSIVDIA